MSSVALARGAVSRPAINYWVVAAVVVVPTFMEILDTTIANVALRYIAGGLSAAQTDADWVITSYLAANAVVLPITGWLSAHLGRRNYFLLSIAIFQSYYMGLRVGEHTAQQRHAYREALRNFRSASDQEIACIFPDPAVARSYAAGMQRLSLSVFAPE